MTTTLTERPIAVSAPAATPGTVSATAKPPLPPVPLPPVPVPSAPIPSVDDSPLWTPAGRWGAFGASPVVLSGQTAGTLKLTLQAFCQSPEKTRPDPVPVQARIDAIASGMLRDSRELSHFRKVDEQLRDLRTQRQEAQQALSSLSGERAKLISAMPADLANALAAVDREREQINRDLVYLTSQCSLLEPVHRQALETVGDRIAVVEMAVLGQVQAEQQLELEAAVERFCNEHAEELTALARLSQARSLRLKLSANRLAAEIMGASL